uniref:Uncharacterized protein n=1 Tax=Psilocybe cubensis TaxID=181762 RepID=A0A8H7Y334_PSICU
MIINALDTHGTAVTDTSDAVSTNTLVSDEQKIPKYFARLVAASLGVVAPILAFIFTLPHHGATLLLKWLQHHDMASILPFSPTSVPALVYSSTLVVFWITSLGICVRNIAYVLRFEPNLTPNWSAKGTVATTVLESALIVVITFMSFLRYRRERITSQSEPTPVTPQSELKAI